MNVDTVTTMNKHEARHQLWLATNRLLDTFTYKQLQALAKMTDGKVKANSGKEDMKIQLVNYTTYNGGPWSMGWTSVFADFIA